MLTSINPWLGMSAVVAMLALSAGLLRWYQVRAQPHPEVVRKLLHVLMGLATLPFPWVFASAWPVVTLAVATTALLLAVRLAPLLRNHVGGVLHDVDRRSYGELCFPAAVCLVFVLAQHHPLAYVLAILLLTLADPLAALVGLRYGRLRYRTLDDTKTVEGSAAFFLVAFFCSHIVLLLGGEVGQLESLFLALLIATAGTLTEAASWHGLDNLFTPLAVWLVMRLCLGASDYDLSLVLTVMLVLFAGAALGGWVAHFNSSAVVGAALVGLVTWMIGGWPLLALPALLYVTLVVLWAPRAWQMPLHLSSSARLLLLGNL